MNKYHLILNKILAEGKIQENKKGPIRYLLNEQLTFIPLDLLDIISISMRIILKKRSYYWQEKKV